MAPSPPSPDLTPLQTLLLFKLLFTGEEPPMSQVKPGLSPQDRRRLEQLGLIALEKRKGRSGRLANHIVLTDRAWQWAGEHLDAPFSRTINGAHALAGLLPRLKRYLELRQVALADLLAPPPDPQAEEAAPASPPAAPLPAPDPASAPPSPLSPPAGASVEERICAACLEIAGGVRNTRVRLSALRARLADVPRRLQDETLIRMQQAGRLTLQRLDDPADIGPDDAAAALPLGSQMRHILYLGD